jgi:hypothetical protein
VFGFAVALAAVQYRQFLEDSRQLWTDAIHDRTAHYAFGVNIALDLRHAEFAHLLSDLDSARMWPPLHGILLGIVLAIGGIDARLGVLPSLAAWVGTAVFGFLLARRAVPRFGNLAGFIAAVFILVSPAHRAYGTDIMLESLGACLSLLALYLYLVTVQDKSGSAGRALGLVLTALCIEKYNYWLLVVFAILASELTSRFRLYFGTLREAVARVDWRSWARRQLRQPLNYLLIALIGVAIWVLRGGAEGLAGEGSGVSLRSPHNVVTLAYLVFFVQLAWWWRSSGNAWSQQWDGRIRNVALWHIWPVAVWFLWPKRLSYFLWFALANGGEHPQHGFWSGLEYYSQGVVAEYHWVWWSAAVAAALVALAVLACRNLRPGGAVVLWFLLIATFLACNHPNRKHRFLHSWIASTWVAAGMGAAALAGNRWLERRRLQPWLAGTIAAGIALTQLPGLNLPAHAEEGGLNLRRGSALDLTDAYLPDLADATHPTILSTMPIKHLTRWTYLERYGNRDRLETDIKHFGNSAKENRQCFDTWLKTTSCDKLVFVDIPAGSYFAEDLPEAPGLRQMIMEQCVFNCVRQQESPQYGCMISIWERARSASK